MISRVFGQPTDSDRVQRDEGGIQRRRRSIGPGQTIVHLAVGGRIRRPLYRRARG